MSKGCRHDGPFDFNANHLNRRAPIHAAPDISELCRQYSTRAGSKA